ncbi:MAG: ABC transporter permease [Campylobacteraceae bacterium]|jgi:putative ABC transport system permease protein|nr:ABC transporter permease [Campylobacteraceae bacterium]
MEFKIIKSAIFGNKTQKLLAFFTILLASMLISCMLNITLGIGDKLAKELRNYGSNIIVLPRGGSLNFDIGGDEFKPLEDEVYLDERYISSIKNIFWRNNIVSFAPFLEGKIVSKDGAEFDIAGTYFDKKITLEDEDFFTGVKTLYPFWKIEGNWVKDDSSDTVLIGEGLAKEKGLKLFDTITVNERTFNIEGIVYGSENADNKIIMPLSVANELLDKSGKISWIEVSALTIPEDDLSMKARRNIDALNTIEHDKWYCSAYVGSIAYQIEEEYKDASAKALMKTSEGESQIVKKIQSLMGIVSILALIAASIGISSLMASEIHRRKKEIGLLKALGANNMSIYALFLFESLVVAFFAGVAGALFGYIVSMLMAFVIFSHSVAISWIIMPITISFALLIAIIGSLMPIRNVINLLPAEVLYERK